MAWNDVEGNASSEGVEDDIVGKTHPGAVWLSRAAAIAFGTAVIAFLWACWRNRAVGHPEVRLDQWHHLYLALPFAAAGLVWRRPWLVVVAAVLAADDAWQHVRQVTGAWDYRSPLHLLFARLLWPLAPVQWLVGWLDRVFG